MEHCIVIVAEIDKLILNVIWKYKTSRLAKTAFGSKETKVEGLKLLYSKTYYKAILIKAIMYGPIYTDKLMKQRRESGNIWKHMWPIDF